MRERLDAGAAEHRGIPAVIRTGAVQAVRQHGQARQIVADRGGGDLAAAARQVIGGPAPGGLPQPRLPDRGESEPASQPEHRQVPHVLAGFGLRVQECPGGMPQEAAGELVLLTASGFQVRQARRAGDADLGGDLPEPREISGRPGAGTLLQPVEQLHGGARGRAVQADLAGSLDGEPGRLRLPGPLAERRIGPAEPQQPLVVSAAVPAVPPLARAGRHPAQVAPGSRGRQDTAAAPVPAPPQQRMLSRRRQHPRGAVPPCLREERGIYQGSQPCCRRAGGSARAGHVPGAARPARQPGGGQDLHRGRSRGGHRASTAGRRGLGTRSTAARSRAGSGCRYTFVELSERCPIRSAISSVAPPASATLLPNVCRS